MCHHPNSHTHLPCTHVENTATYDTNSRVQRHKILGATSSSKKKNNNNKISHSVKQSLVLSSSTYAFGSLVVECGESGSVRFRGSNTTNAPHTHTHWICASVHSYISEENSYEITNKRVPRISTFLLST